jgi:ABC-type amino acid transport substrate-binding protein
MSKNYLLLFVSLFVVLLSSCSSVLRQDVVIVGVSPNYPPLTFEKDGKLSGFEIDLLNEVEKITDLKFEYKVIPFQQLGKALLEGDVDMVIGGISITKERKKRYLFTEPIVKGGLMHIVRNADLGKFANMDLMKCDTDLTIGVEASTTGDEFAQKNFKESCIKRYDSAETALWALKNKDVDVVIHDAPVSWTCNDVQLTPLFNALTTEYYAWGLRDGEVNRVIKINDALHTLETTFKLSALWKKWVPSTTTITFTDSQEK